MGTKGFVEQVQAELGIQARYRQVAADDGSYTLRESGAAYNDVSDRENDTLRENNAFFWQTIS